MSRGQREGGKRKVVLRFRKLLTRRTRRLKKHGKRLAIKTIHALRRATLSENRQPRVGVVNTSAPSRQQMVVGNATLVNLPSRRNALKRKLEQFNFRFTNVRRKVKHYRLAKQVDKFREIVIRRRHSNGGALMYVTPERTTLHRHYTRQSFTPIHPRAHTLTKYKTGLLVGYKRYGSKSKRSQQVDYLPGTHTQFVETCQSVQKKAPYRNRRYRRNPKTKARIRKRYGNKYTSRRQKSLHKYRKSAIKSLVKINTPGRKASRRTTRMYRTRRNTTSAQRYATQQAKRLRFHRYLPKNIRHYLVVQKRTMRVRGKTDNYQSIYTINTPLPGQRRRLVTIPLQAQFIY
jgi:hypothetical protein